MRRRPLSGSVANHDSKSGDIKTLKTLVPYLWPPDLELRVRVVFSMFFLVAAKLMNVLVPVIFKHAVDDLAPLGSVGLGIVVPVGLVLSYGAARVLAQSFGELRDILFGKVGQRAIRTIALAVFRHLHRLSLRFHLDRQTGGLNQAIERGSRGVEFLLNALLFSILPTLLEIGLVCGLLWTLYDIRFPLVTLATIAVYVVFTLWVTNWRIKFLRSANESGQRANTQAIDSLINYETVKYFGNEEHEARRYDQSLASYERSAVQVKVSVSVLNLGQGAIIAMGATVMMVMAAYGVADGHLRVGDFVLVNTYLIQLYLQLNALGFIYREIKRSLIDMEDMFALLRQSREIADVPGAPALLVRRGGISFENVSFRYEQDREILKAINFEVPPGHSLAIVGPSGAGKSTLSRLLFRFYDVSAGRILIDGQDIRTVTQASLRAAIGIVPQDTVLFNDTIYYNIAYGRPGASREDVEAAADLARIHDFVVSLPQGYETRVGERGLKLSGGEKQRVAIARTILKGPKILLFDEATSALDTQTEREIQLSLREVSENRTTLMIAHRLSTVVDADEILVLDQGQVVERGRHDVLLAQGGIYSGMWQRQQETAYLQAELAQALAGDGVA
ncbi:ABC transporter ATP-binding protein/permease [Telmatospirillum sp.]|uniref:ABCB family ABC transporter ATP-binding protein/permease n=1 Tax=Telmatospirillum sp. TaxID=2079197 RepID=UPI002851E18B|nr:ABC transporter ATP-binding protein/permease [Telmatospirillum sp.]MDR3437596.1 ABC transporter ATP-binding protein/permease [Telmatospirillum sp.]